MSATSPHKSQNAPASRGIPTPEELARRLDAMLREKYAIDPLPEFTIVVEGTTDRDYILRAVALGESVFGENLLRVPSHLSEAGSSIAIVTPIDPALLDGQGRARGGIKRMAPLAEDLREYVFFLACLRGIVFVFDHDEAGLDAKSKLEALGYSSEQHILTLDSRHHPGACGNKQVVIEDLLSFRIQEEFFAKGEAWCSVDYEAGRAKRFHWSHESKHLLRDHVCDQSTWNDVREIGRLIARVRKAFGLPTNGSMFDHG